MKIFKVPPNPSIPQKIVVLIYKFQGSSTKLRVSTTSFSLSYIHFRALPRSFRALLEISQLKVTFLELFCKFSSEPNNIANISTHSYIKPN